MEDIELCLCEFKYENDNQENKTIEFNIEYIIYIEVITNAIKDYGALDIINLESLKNAKDNNELNIVNDIVEGIFIYNNYISNNSINIIFSLLNEINKIYKNNYTEHNNDKKEILLYNTINFNTIYNKYNDIMNNYDTNNKYKTSIEIYKFTDFFDIYIISEILTKYIATLIIDETIINSI